MRNLLILFIYIVLFQKSTSKTFMLADKYEVCYLTPHSPISINLLNIRNYENIGSFLHCDIYVNRDVSNAEFKMTIGLTRCASREARDTCELFTTLKPQNSCNLLDAKGTMWQKLVDGFEPPLKCPFKKGSYKAENATFDADLFSLFPLRNTYWELNMSFYTSKSELLSVCLGTKFISAKYYKTFT